MAAEDQVPTGSPYGHGSTGDEVLGDVDLSGRTAVVTGGYSGLGLETVRALVRAGAAVVVPARSLDRARAGLAGLQGQVQISAMDLAELSSVRRFADEMLDAVQQLDLLINNAGIMACPEARVGPGWESQFGVNHMGHFALTQALFPLLERTPAARVVSLSSTGHALSDIRWDDLHFEQENYDKWQAYGQAKTANALFANALSRRLRETGGSAYAVHPGGILTPLQRHLPREEMVALGWLDESGELSEAARSMFKTPEQGCATTLWASTSERLAGKPGVYCEDCDVAEVFESGPAAPRYKGVRTYACSDEAAERLWALSEQLLAAA